jgi:thymidylate kinase
MFSYVTFLQIIYLRTTPEVAYQRILARQRSEENRIPFEYIKGT